MKRFRFLVSILVLPLFLMVGCAGNGVKLSPAYSDLLDRTSALSQESADRAEQGRLSADEMKQALRMQSDVWKKFQQARSGQ